MAGDGSGERRYSGDDPILLAQDIPVSFIVETPIISGEQAAVIVQRYWGGNPTPTPMTVHLEADGAYWLIVEVTAGEPAPDYQYCRSRAAALAYSF